MWPTPHMVYGLFASLRNNYLVKSWSARVVWNFDIFLLGVLLLWWSFYDLYLNLFWFLVGRLGGGLYFLCLSIGELSFVSRMSFESCDYWFNFLVEIDHLLCYIWLDPWECSPKALFINSIIGYFRRRCQSFFIQVFYLRIGKSLWEGIFRWW